MKKKRFLFFRKRKGQEREKVAGKFVCFSLKYFPFAFLLIHQPRFLPQKSRVISWVGGIEGVFGDDGGGGLLNESKPAYCSQLCCKIDECFIIANNIHYSHETRRGGGNFQFDFPHKATSFSTKQLSGKQNFGNIFFSYFPHFSAFPFLVPFFCSFLFGRKLCFF